MNFNFIVLDVVTSAEQVFLSLYIFCLLRGKWKSFAKNDKTKNYIFVKADKKSHKIYLDDILFIQSLKDYVRIITGRKKVITKIPISKLEEKLSGDDFIRVHRSYIISLNKIDSFNSEVIDISGNEIPIGRQYKTIVIDVLKSSDMEL